MKDCRILTALQWGPIVGRAFAMGFDDGLKGSATPRNGAEVADIILAGFARRVIDRQKIRQVYGAGFDLARVSRIA
jgi:hypothetical protein